MHVLQAAIGEVAARIDIEQRCHRRIPARGNVFGVDMAFDQIAFDLVSQDDVQWIGQFVRFNTDESGLHARQPAI